MENPALFVKNSSKINQSGFMSSVQQQSITDVRGVLYCLIIFKIEVGKIEFFERYLRYSNFEIVSYQDSLFIKIYR